MKTAYWLVTYYLNLLTSNNYSINNISEINVIVDKFKTTDWKKFLKKRRMRILGARIFPKFFGGKIKNF